MTDAGAAYLDSASSEPLHPAARDVLDAAMQRGYADPRRLHRAGRDARLLLDNARAVVAEALDVRPDEVTFTGSGTEAVHRGLLGLAAARSPSRRPIVHSAVEHSAVVHAARWWHEESMAAQVDALGRCEPADLLSVAHARGACAIALQSANHEVGTTQPVDLVAASSELPLFVDCCASMGRVPLPQGRWAAAAGSAHKWGGPAGVGVLVVRKGARWADPLPPDDRSDERGVGFENVAGALAAAAALQAVVAERDQMVARQHRLIDQVRAAAAGLPDTEVVGDPVHRLPHLVTFSCLYVNAEALVGELDRLGFGVASGSACTASTLQPSAVLAAMGALTHGNLRISLTRETTQEQVDAFCAVLPEAVAGARADVSR